MGEWKEDQPQSYPIPQSIGYPSDKEKKRFLGKPKNRLY